MLALLLSFQLLMGGINLAPETRQIDPTKSKIQWTARKVGGSHTGIVQLKSGQLIMDKEQLVGGSFSVDMTTITDTDLSGEYRQKLENHLKSDDFFGVGSHPLAIFEITRVVPLGPGQFNVSGNLTIKGITREISFPASVEKKNGRYYATSEITIDRSEFDIRYRSESFFDNLGDTVIYDEFVLNVRLETEA